MEKKIKRLTEGLGMGEDAVCRVLNIPHHRYRRHHQAAYIPLTPNARLELRQYTKPLADLESLYRVSFNEVRCAKYGAIPARTYVPHPFISDTEAVLAYIQDNNPTREALRAYFYLLDLDRILTALQFNNSPTMLANTVLTTCADTITYQQIANLTGLSLGYIKHLAPATRGNQGHVDPTALLATATAHGISHAAQLHGVSRATVYYYRNKR